MSTERYKPGFLERWGRRVLISIGSQSGKLEDSGKSFAYHSRTLLFWGFFWSFWIGFLPSIAFVYLTTLLPPVSLWPKESLSYLSLSGFVILLALATFIEFYLLFRLGFYLSYRMAKYADIALAEEPELITPIPGMMARLVLEIPDPRIRLYGIDPYKHLNERALFFRTILYKSKVFLSNIFAKLLLKVFLGRTGLRFLIEYISGPVTGIWDSVTTYIILYELRKRIITRKLSDAMLFKIKAKERNKTLIESTVRAVALSIVFTKTFHPNFEYLLFGLIGLLPERDKLKNLDDWNEFVFSFQNLSTKERKWPIAIFALCSSFDGTLNKEELEAFRDITDISPTWLLDRVRILSETIRKGELTESLQWMEKILPEESIH
ncbi:LBF_2804 family protein [Leptospira terpstrae]|uniref:LBF_2804 family protein n=1 Tax=Leptospira terpstrae TaxID=293075 RepID=UPI003CFC2B74